MDAFVLWGWAETSDLGSRSRPCCTCYKQPLGKRAPNECVQDRRPEPNVQLSGRDSGLNKIYDAKKARRQCLPDFRHSTKTQCPSLSIRLHYLRPSWATKLSRRNILQRHCVYVRVAACLTASPPSDFAKACAAKFEGALALNNMLT